MDEIEIVHRISELVEDEHALEREHAGTAPSDADVARLRAIEVALDQCWDLLRKRRAALARAKAVRLTIVPWCPFARRWLAVGDELHPTRPP